MYNLQAILFFTLINTTIISMDPPKKDNSSLAKRSRSEGTAKRRSAHFPIHPTIKSHSDEKKRAGKSNPLTINELAPIMYEFLLAVRANKIEKVKFYLQNPYLPINVKDEWDNTASHLAALDGHFEIIDVLLGDPRTKVNLRNKHGLFPQALLEKHRDGASSDMHQKLSHYKKILFAHATLNANVEKYALRIYSFYARGDLDQKFLAGTTQIIKRKIENDKKTQDEQLPIQAQLPAYATDNFIMAMLNYELATLSNQKK